jgi:hypothetical protein
MVSTVVDNPSNKVIYGADLHGASGGDSFILFLRGSELSLSLASVSNPQSILLGCFQVQEEANLREYLDAMLLLDRHLVPEGSSLAESFPGSPSLPGCGGCLFLLKSRETEGDGHVYRCGRIWTAASLQGWLPEETLRRNEEEYGEERPLCWVLPPA